MQGKLDFMKQVEQKREAVAAAEAAVSEAQQKKAHEQELLARRQDLREQMLLKDLESGQTTFTLANKEFATKVLHVLIPALAYTKVISGMDDPQLQPGPYLLTAHQALTKICQSRYVKLIEEDPNPLANKEIQRMEADPLVGNILRCGGSVVLKEILRPSRL